MDVVEKVIIEQTVTEKYALYNGDAIPILAGLPKDSIYVSVYSPPFATKDGGALYHYSSSERDLSNCRTYGEFFEHYAYMVREIHRLTLPGRMTVVHCMDVPASNSGHQDYYIDFPGDIIKLHEKIGFRMASPRVTIWKEPLRVRNRTMTKALAHKSIVEDSGNSAVAGADYLLIFRKNGKNSIPIQHPTGLLRYAGERKVPAELLRYKGWTGNQIENRYSHWIWRQYASCFWDDIRGNTATRIEGVLPYRDAKDAEDEKHLHPLQLDVIERTVVLWSNPGEVMLTPCMGVGSEVYGALMNGRRGIGIELKPSYYRQAVKNVARAASAPAEELEQAVLWSLDAEITEEEPNAETEAPSE